MISRRVFPFLLLSALVTLTLAGCGGDDDDDYYDYPYTKDLTLILQVTSPGGFPIGGAQVLIDGIADPVLTDDQLHPLGEGYPDEWQGWLANWTSDAYQVVMNYEGDSDEFEIRVHKDGWVDDSTIVRIDDYEPDHIFIRDVMILTRPTDVGAAAKKPHYAEVVGGPTPLRLKSGGHPMTIIKATDDSLSGK
ncbi:MAG: hypothetical protein ACM3VW_03555 [Bacteroidota bacterium]